MNTHAVPAPAVHTHGTHQSGRRYWRLVARKNTPVQLFSALPGAFNLTSLSDSSGVAQGGPSPALRTYSNGMRNSGFFALLTVAVRTTRLTAAPGARTEALRTFPCGSTPSLSPHNFPRPLGRGLFSN
jgi:hypothetical protein